MAGSYQHCEDPSGNFTFDFIENMGDAHEACEHMYYMIRSLSKGVKARIDYASEEAYDVIYPHRKQKG